MASELSAAQFIERLEVYRSPEHAKQYLRYFKTGVGEYGEGDIFMGVGMGQVFELAKEFINMILKLKPSAAKGTYIKSVYLSSTMSPGLKIDSKSVEA